MHMCISMSGMQSMKYIDVIDVSTLFMQSFPFFKIKRNLNEYILNHFFIWILFETNWLNNHNTDGTGNVPDYLQRKSYELCQREKSAYLRDNMLKSAPIVIFS